MSHSSETTLARLRSKALNIVRESLAQVTQTLRSYLRRPEDVAIAIYPDRLLLAQARRSWRRVPVRREEIRLSSSSPGGARWQPALDALAAIVNRKSLQGTRVSLLVSSHFVHYTLVPWNDLLRTEAEQMAYARQRLVRMHGDTVRNWELRMSMSSTGQSRLACAMAPELLDALTETMAPLGRQYVSLQPHLMACFNSWHRRIDGKARWLAVVEPGLLCLALLGDNQWHSLRTMKLGPESATQLPELLAREKMLSEVSVNASAVMILGIDAVAARALKQGAWEIEDHWAQPEGGWSSERAVVAMAAGV